MHIIKSFGDIHNLQVRKQISKPLAEHLERKLERLRQAVAADTGRSEFSLTTHGPIGVLQKGEQTLTGIGLPESYAEIMPEWVSQLKLDNETYYVLYVMADNDCVIQVYLPDDLVEETFWLWLSEQPMEEEADDMGEASDNEPF